MHVQRRLLVSVREPRLASGIASLCRLEGWALAGPYADASQATGGLAADDHIDAALVEIGVGDIRSQHLVWLCACREVPVGLIASVAGRIPPNLQSLPRLDPPFSQDAVADFVRQLLPPGLDGELDHDDGPGGRGRTAPARSMSERAGLLRDLRAEQPQPRRSLRALV